MAAAAPVAKGSASHLHLARLVLLVVAVVCALLAVLGLPPSGSLVTTYAAVSATARVGGLFAGVSLLTAGALATWWGSSRRAGALLVAAGVLWFAPDWAGWEGGPPVVRGLAALVAPLLPVVLWGLLATLSGSRAKGPAVTAAVVASASAALVAVDDPFLDPVCWPTCSDSALLVTSRPELADLLSGALALGWTAVAAVVLVGAVRRLAEVSTVARRWDGALLMALALVAAGEAVYGLATLTGTETAGDPWFRGLHLWRAAGWSLLAAVAAWRTYRHLMRGRALAGLAGELESASPPGSLAGTLRSLTGDAALDVWYPMGQDGRLVTAEGRATGSVVGPGRTATPLRRGNRTVAVVVHDPVVLPMDALESVLGPAAQLALENERLAAEQLARLHDVQESQRRIVVTGDGARRRIERDLHDGAQQSLLSLSYLLRQARAGAERSGDRAAVAALDRSLRQAQAALDDLRGLAHGIHPAVLSQSGLTAGLRTLAEDVPVPLELGALPDMRFDPSVELAAYVAVRDIAEAADPDATTALAVRARRREDGLVVDIDGGGDSVPASAADRIGALGGRILPTATGVRVELPCGS